MLNTRKRQAGQIAAEYAVVLTAIVAAMFVPVANGQSAIQMLATAIRDFFLNFSFMVSVL
jgi:hypothetical protein